MAGERRLDTAFRRTFLDTGQRAELERLRQLVAGSPVAQLSRTCTGELRGSLRLRYAASGTV